MPSRFLFHFEWSTIVQLMLLLLVSIASRCTLDSIFLLNYLDLCNFHRLMIPNIYTHVAEIICYIRYYFVFFSVCLCVCGFFFFLTVLYTNDFFIFKWMHYDINDRVTYQIDIINILWFICFWWIFIQKRALFHVHNIDQANYLLFRWLSDQSIGLIEAVALIPKGLCRDINTHARTYAHTTNER